MKILIVGSGAREHAIGDKISQNKEVEKVYFAPGNGGTLEIGENLDIQGTDLEGLLKFAKENEIDYTVVGPEDPLNLGIVDLFEENGLKIFGPSKDAAKLEGSKAFAKEFMVKHKIPTGDYIKTEDYEGAMKFIKILLEANGKAVIKADGLCAGKGVFIVSGEKEAEKVLKEILVDGKFGEKKVVIEEFLDGFEMSLIAFVDNKNIRMLPTSKDHKNIYNGDKGPNTGGMGTYSPNIQSEIYLEEIKEEVLLPFLKGIQEDNLDFRGIIFIGLMIGEKGIKVLEFNTRFGDPETQSILNKIDNDLLDIMLKTTEEKLDEVEIEENDKKVVTLVLASGGYPNSYEKGYEIKGLKEVEGVKIYHAGTKKENDKILTSGGRVLSIVGIYDTFEEAIEKVYKEAEKIEFENKYSRKDIGPSVHRFYVEKDKDVFSETEDLRALIIRDLEFDPGTVRIFNRYDVQGINTEESEYISDKVIFDPQVETLYRDDEAVKLERELSNPLVSEFQKDQFNEKEYALKKNLELLTKKEDVVVKAAKVYSFDEILSLKQRDQIEKYIINNTNQNKGVLVGIPSTLKTDDKDHDNNEVYQGFKDFNKEELEDFYVDHGLAMSIEDLEFVQDYFKKVGRDINETELYILDTYWSDHCRHTTFNTVLDIEFKNIQTKLDEKIYNEFENYLSMRKDLNRTKEISLMDLGTIVAKHLKTTGDLDNVEKSDEVNACSIEIEVKIEDRETKEIKTEEYLLMFKNETHNHPTEIEPYGGANTCIGGGIRDPLSGRAYVYQAMRITGAADPRREYKNTIKGKLPQSRIAIEASDGYSAYGNEIGLAGGLVEEIYHEGYAAKRMELGALVGAQKKEYVLRGDSEKGDVILLLGARTGRDGVGAATGSSAAQEEDIIESASPEVQRGNAPVERNIIRLFRNGEATKLIKKSNDFGAGGVSVAIGELADSLDIYLDRVPLKYPGLSPKEIAIAESQERMAVVIDAENEEKFLELCREENIETTHVADVTDTGKMIMYYKDKVVCELDREFLNSSGVDRFQEVLVNGGEEPKYFQNKGSNIEDLYSSLKDLNYVSKKNLLGKFDFTNGRSTILAPLGGKNQITPIQTMAAIIPSLEGNSKTASLMTFGYDPFLSEENQFLGGYYAVIESLTKLAAAGGDVTKARLSFQEFFEALGEDKEKWSIPLKSLLGAFYATREMKVAPIGGKDSMSGTFRDITVPPTLISFAVVSEDAETIISPELKGSLKLGLIETKRLEDETLDHEQLKSNLKNLYEDIKAGNIKSAYSLNYKGLLHSLIEMSLGNEVGFNVNFDRPFDTLLGSVLVEYDESRDFIEPLGLSGGDTLMINGEKIDMERFSEDYLNSLNDIYPQENEYQGKLGKNIKMVPRNLTRYSGVKDDVIALLPIFPGTTGEYDMEEMLLENDVIVKKLVFKNDTVKDLKESITELAKEIRNSHMLIIPSGVVYGDEPEGAAKFIYNVLREDEIRESITYLLREKEGLILGVGSGFQGLVRTGLIPYGEYKNNETSPIFVKNDSNRFSSQIVETIYKTNNSPWLKYIKTDKEYSAPISNGFARLIISEEEYKNLSENEQIVSVYKNNPVGSNYSIEGLMSVDGKILGKMTNFERVKENTLINTTECELQEIIKSGVEYFRK